MLDLLELRRSDRDVRAQNIAEETSRSVVLLFLSQFAGDFLDDLRA